MTEIYVHNLTPFLIDFGVFSEKLAGVGIRWYSLAYLAGFFLSYLLIYHLSAKGKITLSKEQIADFIVYGALGTLIGGRLGYCIFYSPDLLTEFSSSPPFWGVFKVYQGGMASHGGIAGIILACLLFSRKYKLGFLQLVDLTVYGGSLGIFFGRIANFINGELFGREAPATFKWAVKFPQEMYMWTQGQVSKLYDLAPAAEALGEIKIKMGESTKITSELWRSWVSGYQRDYIAHNAINSAIEAMIEAVQKGNEAIVQALASVLTARYPSQLYQALMEGLGVFLILCVVWMKPRKPGVLAGWFGVSYSIARIIGEQFRMPDTQIGFQLFGLTRGQWLSIGFLAFAIGYLVYASRRNSKPIGGWKNN